MKAILRQIKPKDRHAFIISFQPRSLEKTASNGLHSFLDYAGEKANLLIKGFFKWKHIWGKQKCFFNIKLIMIFKLLSI